MEQAIQADSDKKLNVKATGVIAIAVMCSRVLGLIREVVFNALFGSSLMGIFLIAFRAPNLLRDLFAEGALSISFVTVFSQYVETKGDAFAWALASKMLTLTTLLMSGVTLLGIIFAKPLISLLAPGFAPQDAHTALFLTQIMYPFILLVSLAALVMGILNTKNVFGMPALASSFFNIGSILGGVLLGFILDPSFGERALIGLALGTLIGGLLQLLVQVPSLKKVQFKFTWDFNWRDPGIRRILILTLPAIIAAGAVQMNVLINSAFASYVGKEAVTWLNSAFRLMQFPIGVFGVAVATITLPVVSRIAVSQDVQNFGPTLGRALRLAVFLTLPAAVGLWFFAQPIISLIYQHGKFVAWDAIQTANALQFYALGLVAYACIKVLSPAFYAIDKKWLPMGVSFVSIALNIGLNYYLIFHYHMGHCGLALSTTIAASINFITLYAIMSCWHDLRTQEMLKTFFKCSLAAAFLGITAWFLCQHLALWLHHASLLIRTFSLLLALFISGLVYLLTTIGLGVDAAKDLQYAAKRYLRRFV